MNTIHAAKESLILCLTYIKLILLLFLVNLESFLNVATIISSNFGIFLVIAIGVSMLLLIKKQSNLTSLQSFLTNCLGILARKTNVTTSQIIGKCFFKHLILKGDISIIL